MKYTDTDLIELAAIIGGEFYAGREIIVIPVDVLHTVKASGKQVRIIGQIWFRFAGEEKPLLCGIKGAAKRKQAEEFCNKQIATVETFRARGIEAVREAKGAA